MSGNSAHRFVASSSVRIDVVSLLAVEQMTTTDLIEVFDASESAVYNALSDLAERGLVFEGEDGWRLTGHGEFVAASLEQWQTVDGFVDEDPAYWENHRTDVLPEPFRQRLHEIGDYEIVRGEPPEVTAHLDAIATRMNSVEHCQLISPVYIRSHDDHIPDHPETKILLTRGVIDTMLDQLDRGLREKLDPAPKSEVRLAPVEFGLNVSSEYCCLGLPEKEAGENSATLISETDAAIEWGQELFAELWADADPVGQYLRKTGFLGPE